MRSIRIVSLFWLWMPCLAQISSVETRVPSSTTYGKQPQFDEEFVTPLEVDSFGKPLGGIRRKRSPHSNSHTSDARYYSLEGFGEKFHLEVRPNTELLAPGFKVYHRKASEDDNGVNPSAQELSKTTIDTFKNDNQCFYTGRSTLHDESSVALHLCDGMTGLIKTRRGDFLIERSTDPTHPLKSHVLRKRSATSGPPDITRHKVKGETQTHFCGRKRKFMPHVPHKNHWLPDEFPLVSNKTRTKRSYEDDDEDEDPTRSVETLVVADRDMVLKHGTDNVTTYILTVFNMVSMLYQDSAIGNNVSVVLVGLVLLEGDEPGLSLSHSAEQSLNSFCQWQSTIHTSRGTHHDHAVLVTGKDICSWKEGPCDTLGYAPISGMCSKYRSCTVNEDSGLVLAFTIAHEIGHNFGMVHDGQSNSPCKKSKGTIMSPSLSGLDSAYLWSSCSRKELSKFLRSPRSTCLMNKPDFSDELQFPDRLPGQLYDGDMQCKFQFGRKSRLCKHYSLKGEICKALWCERNGRKCETKFLPAAEGTSCGKNKWCRKGICVDQEKEELEPVDGGWGLYSKWSNCSSNCGGGLMTRERRCNNPIPKNGGTYCKGRSKEYKICNIEDCYPSEKSTDQDYCATFNHRTVKSKQYRWKPYEKDLGALARCRIYCTPDKEDTYLVLSTKLPDGKSCLGNFSSVCAEGDCRPVGCDGKVDSNVLPDRCGVCNGTNSTCKEVAGVYYVANFTTGYHHVVKIPMGSRHIHVTEASDSSTYLALRNANNHYYLTGGWAIDWPGRYLVAGAVFSYRRWPGQPESFVSKGPINEDLYVEVLVQDVEPATINYDFVVSSPYHSWKYFNSTCSTSCGNGVIISTPKCMDASGNILKNAMCSIPRPSNVTYVCMKTSCLPQWKTGEWSSCRDGCNPGWSYRDVSCMSDDTEVHESKCIDTVKPPNRMQCLAQSCDPKWVVGSWSACTESCPYGIQKRSVNCEKDIPVQSSMCDQNSRPQSLRKCGHHKCTKSTAATTTVTGTWSAGPWSKCNVQCGRGIQTRNVSCIPINSANVIKSICNEKSKPIQHLACTGMDCRSITTRASSCQDQHRWCVAFTAQKACQYKMYATKCCKTCSKLL